MTTMARSPICFPIYYVRFEDAIERDIYFIVNIEIYIPNPSSIKEMYIFNDFGEKEDIRMQNIKLSSIPSSDEHEEDFNRESLMTKENQNLQPEYTMKLDNLPSITNPFERELELEGYGILSTDRENNLRMVIKFDEIVDLDLRVEGSQETNSRV